VHLKVCAVIPAYNEAKNIRALVQNVKHFLPDVLVVDDGSIDDTSREAATAGGKVLRLEPNRGKGEALRAGYEWALRRGFDALITLDGDGQHDPAEIPRFIESANRTGADIVLGNRLADAGNMPLLRYLVNVLTSLVISITGGIRTHDSQVGYRLIRTRILGGIKFHAAKYDHESEILIRAGRRGCIVREVPIKTIYLGGPSKIHPVKDTIRFFRLVFGFYL
jgi:glycosyltransferase involved in cell wall biosynthesis